ncbi:unnamed protein product, partial [Mesorhabditis spiculigera]
MFFNMGGMGGSRGGGGPADTKLYDLLNVGPSASDDEIKKSYKKLAREYHPDKNPDHGDKFKEISFAYEVLSNPERRRMYDQVGLEGMKEGGGGGFGGSDLFSHLFGDDGGHPFSSFFGGMGGGGQRRRRQAKPTVHHLGVTLEDIYKGKTAKLKLSNSVLCTTCRGSGGRAGAQYTCSGCKGRGAKMRMRQIGPGMIQQMQVACDECGGEGSKVPASEKCGPCSGEKYQKIQKVLEVHVEKGMRHGEQIVFHGQGDQVDPDVEPGDVVIVLNVKDHANFRRNGDNLYMTKEITLNEALAGYSIPITHLDGRKIVLKSRAGEIIRPDDVRGVIGEGMPKRRHHEIKGTLFVKFEVKFPAPHFLDDEKKYQLLAQCFPAPKKQPPPTGDFEEVSLYEYDEKKYGGGRGRGEAYAEESDSDEGGHGGHPGVQCAQS